MATVDRILSSMRSRVINGMPVQNSGSGGPLDNQILERLGRSLATVKAYFYDPSEVTKKLSRSPQAAMRGLDPECTFRGVIPV